MADNKKYYYLKLKDNFFESDEMIVLESMPDGYLYSNILLKLYLRSLKNEGRLMLNNRIPFNSTMLAQVTRHSVGVIEKAMKIFKDLRLIEMLDNGAIYISDIQNFIGQSSTEADRKRVYRARIEKEKSTNLLEEGQMSDKCPDKTTPEIELEIETEIDIELEKDFRKATGKKKDKFITCQQLSMTEKEYNKLVSLYGNEAVEDKLRYARNYKNLKNYVSLYLTLNNWLRKEKKEKDSYYADMKR